MNIVGETSIACIVYMREYQNDRALLFSIISLFVPITGMVAFKCQSVEDKSTAQLLYILLQTTLYVCTPYGVLFCCLVVAKRPMGGIRGPNRGMRVEVHEADQLNS